METWIPHCFPHKTPKSYADDVIISESEWRAHFYPVITWYDAKLFGPEAYHVLL